MDANSSPRMDTTYSATFFEGGVSCNDRFVCAGSSSSTLRFVPTKLDGDGDSEFLSFRATNAFGGELFISGVRERLRLDASTRNLAANVDFEADASA